MTVSSFYDQQRAYFHAQCEALRMHCRFSGLHPLVMMGSRGIFNIYCDGNQNPATHGRPVNDNQLIPRKYTT